jgi:Protein of unknown function DUF262
LAKRPSPVIEEYEDDQPTDVEHDPESDADDVVSPYDPKLIRVDPKVFSVRQVVDMIDDNELDLAPDFQRRRVWRRRQKSLLIESLLLRIPLPAFYFSADSEGRLQVVDGVQRLSTIYEFVHGNWPLDHLEYLGTELNGMTFSELRGSIWWRRILSTQILANVIDPQTPDAVKFDIFRRINTGGSPLNAQEIRHCMSTSRSREFLRTLCDTPSFVKTVGKKIVDHVRMVDRELALRYAAFKLLDSIDEYQQYASMDDFLTAMNRKLDDPKQVLDRHLSKLKSGFEAAMNNAFTIFSNHAFRKWPEGHDDLYPVNRALFDVWSVQLSNLSANLVETQARGIARRARTLMTVDEEFIAAISTGTSSSQRVLLRFDRVRDLLGRST